MGVGMGVGIAVWAGCRDQCRDGVWAGCRDQCMGWV